MAESRAFPSNDYSSPPSPGNHPSLTSKHKNLGQSLSSRETELIEESALTLVRQKNHYHTSHPMPRHCGSGKEHRREGEKSQPGAAGWGLECDLLPNNYTLSAGWDLALESVPQKSLPRALPRVHCSCFHHPLQRELWRLGRQVCAGVRVCWYECAQQGVRMRATSRQGAPLACAVPGGAVEGKGRVSV